MNRLKFILEIFLFIVNTSICTTLGTPLILNTLQSEKLVVDTDGAADDINAILVILSAWGKRTSNFEPIAITCTFGSTLEFKAEENVLEALTVANYPFIPVYRGAQNPLTTTTWKTNHYYGFDGFGDFIFDRPITAKVDESVPAALALVNLAKRYKGELNILCLGPQTNIAVATSLDPEFLNNVKKFYIVGGSVAGVGNLRPGKEFNFYLDPASAYIHFNSLTKKTSVLCPWETAFTAGITKEWRRKVLGKKNSETIKFLNKGEALYLRNETSPYWVAADAMCAFIMMWPELITKSVTVNVSPVMDGEGKGVALVDYGSLTDKFKNAKLIQKFNVEKYKEKLLEHYS